MIGSPASIRALRKRLELSQVELAQAIGVHRMTVSKWERAVTRPHGSGLLLLRRLSQCKSVDELGANLTDYPLTVAELEASQAVDYGSPGDQ